MSARKTYDRLVAGRRIRMGCCGAIGILRDPETFLSGVSTIADSAREGSGRAVTKDPMQRTLSTPIAVADSAAGRQSNRSQPPGRIRRVSRRRLVTELI